MTEAPRRLRIAQVAPPVERVPPAAYGGTERVVHELTTQLVERGHDVTLFASGDSRSPARLVPTVDRALRPAGIESDAGGWFATTVKMVIERAHEFDVIHSHLEWWSIPLARLSPVPVAATFHGRLDLPWADRLFRDAPDGMVAISRHQASTHPDVPWSIIHNGLKLDRAPFTDEPGDAFCFVGRVDAEKGIIEAIDIALRAGRRLRIAAKVGNLARQRDYYESVFRPALQRAGRSIEYLGELEPAERDQLFAESYATLMPGAWPEPFGLVTIESLACGTPVLARRVGALPEIIREGVDGYFGDDAISMAFFADRLGLLDRREIRERVIERFSAARMTDRYEELYERLIEAGAAVEGQRERPPDAVAVAEALAEHLPAEVMEPADARLPGVPDVTEPDSGEEDQPMAAALAAPGIQAQIAVDLDTQADLAVAEIEEAIDSVIDSQPEPDREVSLEPATEMVAESEPVTQPEPAAVPEPMAATTEPAEDWAPELTPEAPSVEAVEAAPETIAEWVPEHETAPVADEMEAEAIEAVAAEPEAAEGVAPEAEAATIESAEVVEATSTEPDANAAGPVEVEKVTAALDGAVLVEVDVVAAASPETANGVPHVAAAELEPEPEPVAEAEPERIAVAEPEPVAERETEPSPEPERERVMVAVAEPEPIAETEAEPETAPVAREVPIKQAERSQLSPETGVKPSARPPVAVGPGPGSPDKAAPIVPPKPTAKPAVQKPTRTISIFTRQWKGTSGRGKSAAGRRREGS